MQFPNLNPSPSPDPNNPNYDPNPDASPDPVPIPHANPDPNPDLSPNARAPVFMALPPYYCICSVCLLVAIRSQYTGRPASEIIAFFCVSTEPTHRPAYLPASNLLHVIYTRALSPCRVCSVNSGRVLGVNRYAGGAEVARQPPMPVRVPRAPVGVDGPLQVGCRQYTNMDYSTFRIRLFCLLIVPLS